MTKTLMIHPTFLCPFSCCFCITKNKASLNEYLSLDKLETFLNENKFDNFIISGGEPSAFSKSYFDAVVDIAKKHSDSVSIFMYPYTLTNFRDDVEYMLSYDFLARARATEVWENLLSFPKPFDLKLTLSPGLMKYHPNMIFKKLSLLNNIKSVELLPYFKSESTFYNLTTTNAEKYIKAFLTSGVNIPYTNLNIEKIKLLKGIPTTIEPVDEFMYHLLPDGKLTIDYFENELHSYKEIESLELFEKPIIPKNMNLYNEEFQECVI